jgi:hypothetical protein
MNLQYVDNARFAQKSWFEKLTGFRLPAPTPQDINQSTLVPDGIAYVVKMGERKSYWHGVTFRKMLSYAFLRFIGAAMFATPSAVAFGVIAEYPAMGAMFLLFSVVGLIYTATYISEVCNIRRVSIAT